MHRTPLIHMHQILPPATKIPNPNPMSLLVLQGLLMMQTVQKSLLIFLLLKCLLQQLQAFIGQTKGLGQQIVRVDDLLVIYITLVSQRSCSETFRGVGSYLAYLTLSPEPRHTQDPKRPYVRTAYWD